MVVDASDDLNNGTLAAALRHVAQLEAALARRARIERAEGVLMERHQIDERDAPDLAALIPLTPGSALAK